MEIFLITLCFLTMIGGGIALIMWLISLSDKIKSYTQETKKLEEDLYTNLRLVQFNAKNCRKAVDKLIKSKDTLVREIIEDMIISILPFKKIKKLLLTGKLIKKFL